MAPPVIKQVLKHADATGFTVIDCPPGTSCSMVNAVKMSQFTILVAEPTPFGLHDFKSAAAVLSSLNIPFGVIINKYGDEDNIISRFCNSKNIEVMLQIPEVRAVAENYSSGIPILESLPGLEDKICQLIQSIYKMYG
jgi:MinD superfamily P-loop ATPase